MLGTMMMGLATPTEAGAMGAVGAIVLAAIHSKDFSTTGRKILIVGVIAGGIGTIVGIFLTEGIIFKTAFAVTYFAVVWICIEAVRIPVLRDLIKQGYETTMRITTMVVFILIGSTCFSVVFLGVSGGVWLEHLLTSLPGGVWGFLIFINLFIFFVAFFLDFFEIAFIILPMIAPIAQKILAPVVGPGCRTDLVRGHALREHADVVHASAVRFCAVLSARGRTQGGQELRYLSGAPCPGWDCRRSWSPS